MGAELVGPSPVRRLSDAEYFNALRDLFPQHNLTLPELPREHVIAGFENAALTQQPSDVRIARYETIALRHAQALTRDTDAVRALVACETWESPESAKQCATQFVTRMGNLLFRRPITSAESDRFLRRFADWHGAIDFDAAVRLTTSSMLQAPQFLYRIESRHAAGIVPDGTVVRVDGHAMASRLSFFLWESIPDEPLLEAAAQDALQTTAQITAQVERMLQDPRSRRAYWGFFRQWLGLDRILEDEHQLRTPAVDPLWNRTTPAAALNESKHFIENVLHSGGSFQDIFESQRAWIDAESARLYGLPSTAPVENEVLLPAAERAGILTRTSFLAALSHPGGTSPPIRGNAIFLRVLCQSPVPPPPDADLSMPVQPMQGAPQTNRMLFETRTRPSACSSCHRILNGYGFGFENYSASGQFQSTDNGLPVDSSGEINGTNRDGPFKGAIELSHALAIHPDVRACAASQWIRYALGRAAVEVEEPSVQALTNRFTEDGGNIRALLTGITTMPSFRMMRLEGN
jgi:Protein of unknown function (DUF1592)/Protein of unknown function (DUF1588)/Protein of unknown function (DUF1595)/Protein of unknown function (DUF1585)/Protein of unknown function (DUF1587)